ncbi:unnamed protein product [Hermetia illucens]|uniref:CHK kinase-like domain-containing protein n=2 Tax=Hermetia illucens TaxID=343691 RepID=A0A7R8V2N3_HERIL|nr:uncharacterized protein LOC119656761 isoform X2 [Hermetia illucens]XP_037919262.1 uncharacterized protein LOC119656761 isoform X2 [Hermetia illucens]XP_037919264.1 uncharacterized protein LOC119656761 isoform X2 [Hermetia illucens]XP_037919265.1 uncharacterized protein LOC119656761 isoform X2 [Hermetia illucens]CAD7091513.1 unnamed protein product [Hermetia illucens]
MIIQKNNNNIPEYLDEQFFKEVLVTQTGSEDVKIFSLDFSMGSSAGENYLSFIYRVQVVYTLKGSGNIETNFIVKSIPLDGAREAFVELDIFNSEKVMYFDILPRIESCLDNMKIAPKCYYVTSKPIATIVFEDMKVPGYSIADRVKGLDLDHSKIILTKLAQYHAGGMLLLEKEPSLTASAQLKRGIFSSVSLTPTNMGKPLYMNVSRLVGHASKWYGYEKIVDKLQDCYKNETLVDKILDTIRPSPDDILGICHGDCWVNNFLFKYKEDLPIDAVFVDFQGSMRGSIGLDINYFFASSLQIDVLHNNRDQLIEEAYYPAFRAALERGFYKNIPTIQNVKDEIKRKAMFGFLSSILVLPAIAMNKEDSADNSVETFKDEEKAKKIGDLSCSSERFLESQKILLKEYDSYGFFD